jgi:TonB-linked SusC/RagA family outer membrane protein
MRNIFLLLICFSIDVGIVFGQNKQVSGIVKDNVESSVAGVSIIVKGTSIGIVTDSNGEFSLNVPESATTIVVSYVGLKEKEVDIAPYMNIVLEPDVSALDEVVVVAYGTTKKSSFTGSATTLKGTSLEKIQSSDLSKALEGEVAGMSTTSGSGQPGASASIIVRGLGSINASRNPLIIMDGVPYEGSLNSISAFDVESLTVLKDAAANSMYGARGSNGVIIVTTKQGKSGKPSLNFDARIGANSRGIPAYDVIQDPGTFYELYWESLRNDKLDNNMDYPKANNAASADLIDENLKYNIYKNVPNDQLIDPATGKLNPNAKIKKWNDNWMKDPFTNGLRQEYNFNVSAGTGKTDIYASLSYLNDKGYVVNSDFQRISARLKVDQKITDFMKIGGSINYANTSQNNVSASNTNYSNIFMFGQQIAPIYPIYLYNMDDGELILNDKKQKQYDFGTDNERPYASEQNPMATLEANIYKIIYDIVTSRGFFEVNFLKDFKFTMNLSYDVFNLASTDFSTPIGGDAVNVGGRGYKESNRYTALNANQLLNYSKKINNHSIDVLLGHESKKDNRQNLYGHMTRFVDPENPEFSNASQYQDLTSSYQEYSLEGYFSRMEYNYGVKYYFTASVRADASSRFHPDVRWGNFWAVGASWRLSKENFLSDVAFINNLKFKTSYGTQGNDNLGVWYAYKDLYAVNRVNGEPAMSRTFRGNPQLTWEKSNNFNIGFEASVWNDRLSLNVDYFIKKTTDLLYKKPMSISEGLPDTKWVNDIDMQNNGVEIELGLDIIKSNDLKWRVNLNGTHYKNKLTKLPSDKPATGYQTGSYWRELGGSIFDYYTYEYAGVDNTGLALYNTYIKDANGKETVETTTVQSKATLRKTGKSPIPDIYGGFGSSIDFKGFDFSVQTAFQLGGYVMDEVYQSLMNPGNSGRNFHKDALNRWTPENTGTDVPKLIYESQNQAATSNRWLTKSSYFSIRNITLGYSFPKKMIQPLKLEKLRVYAVADNVWYTSKRRGLDVRQSFDGSVSYAYSVLRTISFGVSVGF